ncbi:MAG: DUF5915 domain-containing protein, partial [Candidatus Aenigmatarchaeota archaeon]
EGAPEELTGKSFHNGIIYLEIGKGEDLKEEREIRDLIRQVQKLRKEMGFNVGEKIDIVFSGEKEKIGNWKNDIKKETGAHSISFGKVAGKEIEFGDRNIRISLEK